MVGLNMIENKYNFFDILDTYNNTVSKRVKNKKSLIRFESNKMAYISNLYNNLINNRYKYNKYNIFVIHEHKYRIIMAPNIFDKIINHYITNYFLNKKLSIYLDKRNIATRKNMGTDCGIKLIKRYYEIYKKYNTFYILKLDIKKYFYSIDHNVLNNLIIDKLNIREYEIICNIIDSTNDSYINEEIRKIKNNYNNKEIDNIPYYLKDKGLAIGLMTNQLLAIFYLYKLHNFINKKLKLKHFISYMDDIIIFHKDKNYLKYCLKEIEEYLKSTLKLELNRNKTKIVKSNEWLEFLGYNFKVDNKKTIIKLRSKSLKRIKNNIKKTKYLYESGKISFEKSFCIINNYKYSYKYVNNKKIDKIINKYWRLR